MYWPLLIFASFLVALAAGNDTIPAKRSMPTSPRDRKYILKQCPWMEIRGPQPQRNQQYAPAQSLFSECKNNRDAGEVTAGLCLNRCLGWDKTAHKFTAEKNGNGLASWNGNCWNCRFQRNEQGDNVFCHCANVPEPKDHTDRVTGVKMGLRSFNLDGVLELGTDGVLKCHGISGHC